MKQYIHAIVFSAPFCPSKSYLSSLPISSSTSTSSTATPLSALYHGPTSFIPLTYDPYTAPKQLGIFHETGSHDFAHVNAGEIVQRIMKSREAYEARQRAKGVKAVVEEEIKAAEGS